MMRELVAYDWPGNIRELENFLARAIVLCPGDTLDMPLRGGIERPGRGAPAQFGSDRTGTYRKRSCFYGRGDRRAQRGCRNPEYESQHAPQQDAATGYPPLETPLNSPIDPYKYL